MPNCRAIFARPTRWQAQPTMACPPALPVLVQFFRKEVVSGFSRTSVFRKDVVSGFSRTSKST